MSTTQRVLTTLFKPASLLSSARLRMSVVYSHISLLNPSLSVSELHHGVVVAKRDRG
jgi:hypothetical protein